MGPAVFMKHGLGLVLLASVGAITVLYVSWKCRERIRAGDQDRKGVAAEEKDGTDSLDNKLDDADTGDATTVEDEAPDPLNRTYDGEQSSPAGYLHQVREERERLAARCLDAERYQRWNLPADVLENVRSAIGQSKLITTNQKSPLAILEGQCLDAMAPGGDNPYRPTLNDLAAYFDVVEMQVQKLDNLFDELELIVKRQSLQ